MGDAAAAAAFPGGFVSTVGLGLGFDGGLEAVAFAGSGVEATEEGMGADLLILAIVRYQTQDDISEKVIPYSLD